MSVLPRRIPFAAALSLLLFLGLTGCSTGRAALTETALTDLGLLTTTYQASIQSAAVYDSTNTFRLLTITTDSVTVVTWTNFPTSYPPGRTVPLTWGDVWVTVVPEVKAQCEAFIPALRVLRMEQLLGLPPNSQDRTFVELRVAAADLFRPCTNPALTTTTCDEAFPAGVSDAHVAWIANQMLSSYQIPNGYPWTRLGYTYDWNPATDRYGASEFVIRQNSVVKALASYSTAAYCGATGG